MQKIGILNSDIAKVLADLGHTDTIVIGDCGLPVPAGVPKIDLALKPGTPSFLDVLTEVLKYMEVEKYISLPKWKVKILLRGRKCRSFLKVRNRSLATTKPSKPLPKLLKQ